MTALCVWCLAPKPPFFRGHRTPDTTDTLAPNPYPVETPADTIPDTAQTPSV
ncbi:hypothetical protein [Nostoc sp. WHI]|uniref:hypothetical protein n=1 Tax=Nostoc sp. WHI TaxID=2650611 RepID=UPI001E531E70|nr:hypothetical protein [Nostoc sp. WHI]